MNTTGIKETYWSIKTACG